MKLIFVCFSKPQKLNLRSWERGFRGRECLYGGGVDGMGYQWGVGNFELKILNCMMGVWNCIMGF